LIYGEGHECIEKVLRDVELFEKMICKEDWAKEIKDQFPTAEGFMGMNVKEKRGFRVAGKGLTYIATCFFEVGLKNSPRSNEAMMALLAEAIYGEGHECIECCFWKKEEWQNKIKEKYSIVAGFMGLTQQAKLDFRVAGKGLTYIANSVFGLEGKKPVDRKTDYVELARFIYGNEAVDAVLDGGVSLEE
jgi:hypothetical protein